jgi:hypothetical protein
MKTIEQSTKSPNETAEKSSIIQFVVTNNKEKIHKML